MIKKIILISAAIIIATSLAFSQGTAINKTGATAHNSAILDVSDTTKGILIPRMTKANKLAISSPATGLMIYQTNDTTGFWYYNGVKWEQAIGTQGPAGGGSTCAPAGAGETLINFNGCMYVNNTDEGSLTWAAANTTCASKGTGWYLPDLQELYVLYLNWDHAGQLCKGSTCPLSGFANAYYWSSTTFNSSMSWSHGFSDNMQGAVDKTSTLRVRCIKR